MRCCKHQQHVCNRTGGFAGCVTLDTSGTTVQLLDGSGADVTDGIEADGTNVAKIQLVDKASTVVQSFARNKWGTFFKVYQPNKWQKNRGLTAEESMERETIMA